MWIRPKYFANNEKCHSTTIHTRKEEVWKANDSKMNKEQQANKKMVLNAGGRVWICRKYFYNVPRCQSTMVKPKRQCTLMASCSPRCSILAERPTGAPAISKSGEMGACRSWQGGACKSWHGVRLRVLATQGRVDPGKVGSCGS